MNGTKAITAIFSAILLILAPVRTPGQTLPLLEKDNNIVTGRLPDGITYYLINNTQLPGVADFALVQPQRSDVEGARRSLASLPHFKDERPGEFLARNGVGYAPLGFIRHLRGATVFRFADVPVSSPSVSDSTLLLLFDLAATSEYRQAIIISGDIDVPALTERIRILSMTIPQRKETEDELTYGWKSQDEAISTTGTSPVGLLRVMYRSPRTDAALMNTIQPIMGKLLARELSIILEQRLKAAFAAKGIPLADCRLRYVGSDQTAGDETYSITVETAPEMLDDAIGTLGEVLGTIDRNGATQEEVTFARSIITESTLRDDDNYRPDNATYVDKCIAAYLYGANLASYQSLSKTFTGRKLDIDRERELLDRYISALLTRNRNMHIHASAPVKPDPDLVKTLFQDGWRSDIEVAADIPTQSDTLLLTLPRGKVKLKNASAESFSGGTMWTFSNGASVIFKKTADKGSFRFGYMVKGGWTEIQGITGAESAFVDDALTLESVAGMSGEHFRNLLEMNGITLEGSTTMSDVRWTGSAPKERLQLVLKALLVLSGNTSADAEAFRRYQAEEAVRQVRDRYSASGTRAVMDSTMCPGYVYASGSMPPIPGSDFPERVDSYLSRKGSTVRNSLIVLAGDLDEAAVQKALTHMLAGLGTTQQRIVRPRISYPLRECWSTTRVLGTWRDRGVTVGIKADWPFSSGSNTGLKLACCILEAELARSLAPVGYSCSVSAEATLLPSETISVMVACKPVPPMGLPAGVTPATPAVALNAVRATLHRLSTEDVSPSVLASAKATLSNHIAASEKNTVVLVESVLWRNSLGRDITGSYKDRIKAIKASDVRAMFAAMDACNCEFVVQ